MNLAERLRGVIRPARGDQPFSARAEHDPAETLGGEWRDRRGHRYLVVDRTYHAGYRLGRVAVADCLPPDDGLWPRLALLMTTANAARSGRPLFLDLETTGLAGGAGTYAFLVGCGWFQEGVFRVRQFVMTSVAAERALLEDVESLVRTSGVLITYNGKTFDAPLIDTRFLFHRLEPPFANLTHIDLLHPARKLWSPSRLQQCDEFRSVEGDREASCRLSQMEVNVLGHVREHDVPGFDIPSRYFHFVRSGDARSLEGVLEHNRQDLLALAMLTQHVNTLLEDGAPSTRTAREALGLGRIYERADMIPAARSCFVRAIELESDVLTHVEALRAYALLSRRERHHGEAAAAWAQIVSTGGCPPRLAREANEALAVHYEHRSRDLAAARECAVQSLQFSVSRSRVQAVQHRLARIDRKISREPAPHAAQLF